VRTGIPFLAACAATALLAGGCGNDRAEPPDLDQLGAGGEITRFEGPAVGFRYPQSWLAIESEPPRYAQLSSGSALVVVYGYPRSDLATDSASVEASRRRLISSLRRRAPGFLVLRSEIGEVDDAPAVEIRGRGLVAGEPVETRAVHVYKPGVEWVIDAYAGPKQFAQANRIAFEPLLESIELADQAPSEDAEGAR
jgi:hypothetical protein